MVGQSGNKGTEFDFEQGYTSANVFPIGPDLVLGKSQPQLLLSVFWNPKQPKGIGVHPVSLVWVNELLSASQVRRKNKVKRFIPDDVVGHVRVWGQLPARGFMPAAHPS